MTKNSTRLNRSNSICTKNISIDRKHKKSFKEAGPSKQTLDLIYAYARSVKSVNTELHGSFLTPLN